MVGAIVEILVAEKTTPAFSAMAFPWFLAGSVDAARVGFTFVAHLSLPTGLTSEMKKKRTFIISLKIKVKGTIINTYNYNFWVNSIIRPEFIQ